MFNISMLLSDMLGQNYRTINKSHDKKPSRKNRKKGQTSHPDGGRTCPGNFFKFVAFTGSSPY
jgi:hypothetical protein